ncbi:NAD(P)/FAD-dependent oxidoreductase [Metabacillus sp. GX 13764]|uniref:NAD(P)/FAD-dependent oxidoreductase n=1 Tax=Metabacillus kandeliae TaxID=2900151 RepID=UPI001E3EFBB0|nr:NAD(P)/FAD-dependent oxidoreductase [Metabacillus kandeliae]
MTAHMYDVLIAGGGPAGLSAALVLGRARRTVLVVDDDKPRNAVVKHSHGFLTRDGIEPMKLRQIAKEQISKYQQVEFEKDCIDSIEKEGSLFLSYTKSGKAVYSRRVIIATGMKDELPDIDGLDEVYGKSVFTCPYCDGWEHQDQPLAVFGEGKKLLKFAAIIWNWSKDLIVFTNGRSPVSDEDRRDIQNHGIRLVETPVKELVSEKGMLQSVVLENGETISRKYGFIQNSGQHQATNIPGNLGIQTTRKGGYETIGHGLTEMKGLFVVGDAKNAFTSLIGAAGEGYEAGVAMDHDMIHEDWEKVTHR